MTIHVYKMTNHTSIILAVGNLFVSFRLHGAAVQASEDVVSGLPLQHDLQMLALLHGFLVGLPQLGNHLVLALNR